MSVFFFVAFGRQATMGEEEVEEQAWEVLWTSLDQAAGHIQRGAMALCTYYEDAVGPGTCDDLARAFSSTRDALHYWARVWTAALCALVVFLYENPIVLAVVAGARCLLLLTSSALIEPTLSPCWGLVGLHAGVINGRNYRRCSPS